MKKTSLCFLLIPFILGACGSQGNNSSSHQNGEDVGLIKEDVSIEFLCLTDSHYQSELERMINEFKEIEPHVTVNLTNPPAAGNYTVLEKTVVSGFFKEEYPDIVQCYPDNAVQYIDRGYAIKMDDYLNNETYGLKEEKDDYIASFLEEGSHYQIEGTYSLPFCKSTELMYYNADALLNIDLSTIDPDINKGKPLDEDYLNNLTWDEIFDKLCPALKTYNATHNIYIEDETTGIFTCDSDENFFITLAEQYGYGYTSKKADGKGSIDYNNDGMKSLMKKLKTAKDNGYLQTRGSYGDYVSSLFTSKRALFTVSSTAGLEYNFDSNNPFLVGVAKLPQGTNESYTSINQGPSVCFLDHHNDNRALASYLFWKHITNAANCATWAVKTGYMGIRKSTFESEEYLNRLVVDEAKYSEDKYSDLLYDKAVSANLQMISKVSSLTFDTAVFRGSSNARTNVGLLLQTCLKNEDLDNNIDQLFLDSYTNSVGYLGD